MKTPKRILIMGLPGAGKTTLAAKMAAALLTQSVWVNADTIRQSYNDWDFSAEGRLRQARRMRAIADHHCELGRIAICDFVAPTEEIRLIFDADVTVWVDTIAEGRFDDTNRLFVPPTTWDFRITTQDADRHSQSIIAAVFRNDHNE